MASKQKRTDKKQSLDCLASYKKIRKDWGGVKPVTQIEKSKKMYNRKKEREKWRETLNGEV